MVKRFSARETALLMLPVAFVGTLGWWGSKRPRATLDEEPLRLGFHLEKPTALEAFRGANATCVVEIVGPSANNYQMQQVAAYLEVKTPQGVATSWAFKGHSSHRWDYEVWSYSSLTLKGARLSLKTPAIPAGTLHFGCYGIARPSGETPLTKPVRVSGKWKVDRAQFKAPDIASWPRQPLVMLREVVIKEKRMGNARAGVPNRIAVEPVFTLNGAAMDEKTSFEANFSSRESQSPNRTTYGTSYLGGAVTRAMPRRRTARWSVSADSLTNKIYVSGRASADNRWPLGFQIEPFDFKTAKVGQKLRFKQFPVALPPLKP